MPAPAQRPLPAVEITRADIDRAAGLAHHIARCWRTAGSDIDDMESDALLALVMAARSWDPHRLSWEDWVAWNVRRRIVDGVRQRAGDARNRHRRPTMVDLEECRSTPDPAPCPEDGVMRMDDIAAVRAAVARLSPADQSVAWASTTVGGQAALARTWGISEAAVSHRRRLVHARLRRLLAARLTTSA